MKKVFFALIVLVTTTLQAQEQDSVVFNRLHEQFAGQRAAFIDVAKSFIGTPYVAGTLDLNSKEKLVVSLTKFDCSTFVETALAMWCCNAENWWFFEQELGLIRYREGNIAGYSSRLHYATDWIYNNEQKGLLRDITSQLGGVKFDKQINYMTTHASAYSALQNDTTQLARMRLVEEDINTREHIYIPKAQVANIASKIPEGSIIAITTTTPGLDCAHMGIAIKQNGTIYLLHASSKQKQVCISSQSLANYLNANKNFTGIIVAEPVR